MKAGAIQKWLRKALVPSRSRYPEGHPRGFSRPVYVTLTWKGEYGSHTIKRVHFDSVEAELLNLLRRGVDATVWTEGENPREVGWVWVNGNRAVQCVEKWD
ncbi:MAG TPA: hypothetical protein DCY13_20105 [Verrucomicrobiales bacterium]|nr:hypothetical protein [Verrucomicrobiales bacterium]